MKSNATAAKLKVPFSYLDRQFAEIEPYLQDIKALVQSGAFTLGKPLAEFERKFAELCGMPYAVGVGTGTDALSMSLKVLGVGHGDEVITTPMTFYATVGAIVQAGAKPVFVDSTDGFVIDAAKVEAAITPRTKAILPVHYTGNVPDMPAIRKIADKHKLFIVEDACQAIMASYDGKPVGSWGETAGFSLHPLKNLNVWGDGGVIVTRSEELARKLRLYRNHGMASRDEIEIFGINCRMDTLQAVVGNRLIGQTQWITEKRIANAQRYDQAFADMADVVRIPRRDKRIKAVYHLYMLMVDRRDELLAYLQQNGIEARVHYRIPLHLQQAAHSLGYRKGDFPKCEQDCRSIITLPVHQHLTDQELDYAIEHVRAFYSR